jgi:ketosteroid isomerase-like protein
METKSARRRIVRSSITAAGAGLRQVNAATQVADMITKEFAQHFASEWIDAWNAHDLDRILSHYSDDFTMSSPRIAAIAEVPTGILRGKDAIRAYWKRALELTPTLHFDLIDTFVGADSVVLHYRRMDGRAAEVFFFDRDGKVVRASANYQ